MLLYVHATYLALLNTFLADVYLYSGNSFRSVRHTPHFVGLSACFEEKHAYWHHIGSQRGICDTIWEKRNKPGLFMPQLKHIMKINAVSLIRIQAGSLYFKSGAGWTTLTINYKLDITSEVRRKPHFRCFTTFHTTIVPQTLFVNIDFDN